MSSLSGYAHLGSSPLGHIEQGTELNAEADLQHNREYLNFFESLGLTKPESERTLTPKQIWDKFVERFPHCKENLVSVFTLVALSFSLIIL